MNERDEIIGYCIANRVSTTEASDALGKSGVIGHFSALTSGLHRVGRIRCLFVANDSNFHLHPGLEHVMPGDVAVIFTFGFSDRAVLGQLISKYACLYRGAAALVVQGLVRDRAALLKDRWPIWCQGHTPLGCWNDDRGVAPAAERERLSMEYEGGVAICDDGGVVLIPTAQLTSETASQLRRIEAQEDVWFFCLDALKWNTKEIVVDRRYLTDPGIVPPVLLDHLGDGSMPRGTQGSPNGDK